MEFSKGGVLIDFALFNDFLVKVEEEEEEEASQLQEEALIKRLMSWWYEISKLPYSSSSTMFG